LQDFGSCDWLLFLNAIYLAPILSKLKMILNLKVKLSYDIFSYDKLKINLKIFFYKSGPWITSHYIMVWVTSVVAVICTV